MRVAVARGRSRSWGTVRGGYLPELVYEVTIRTLDGTFWLQPDPLSAAIVAGVFGPALQRYPGVRLHGYDAQSNHMHYLLSASEPAQLPRFIGSSTATWLVRSTTCGGAAGSSGAGAAR